MKQTTNLKISLAISCACALFGPLLFPKMRLFFFVPYLVQCFYSCSRFQSIMRSFFVGIMIDLLSFSFFGLHALCYSITSFLLWGQKRNFFEDKLFTLPLMTAAYSFVSTLVFLILFLFLGVKISFSWHWCLVDLLALSFMDALYAFLFFSLPFPITSKISKMILFRKRSRAT